jgi:putative intracellular protease/amidase
MGRAYTLIFDGYADWELGHVLAELRRFGQIEVVTVGFSDEAVVSMGGLRVVPDTSLPRVDPDDVRIFILPGGHLWEGTYPRTEIEPLLRRLQDAEIPIAAICAATTAVARAGLLGNRRHTSNSLGYLSKMVPEYSGGQNYVDSLATRDRHLITASGLGSIEFTMAVFDELDVATPELRSIWHEAFKHGKYPESVDDDA